MKFFSQKETKFIIDNENAELQLLKTIFLMLFLYVIVIIMEIFFLLPTIQPKHSII